MSARIHLVLADVVHSWYVTLCVAFTKPITWQPEQPVKLCNWDNFPVYFPQDQLYPTPINNTTVTIYLSITRAV